MMKTYKDLEIYQESLHLFYRIHALSLRLPKYELYELGSQIRRSSESVNSNIVEGYGRRFYKSDFIRFLIIAHSSGLETLTHIDKLKHLYPMFGEDYNELYYAYDKLNAKIFKFIQYVKTSWKTRA